MAPGGEWREFLLYSAQDQSKSTANPEAVCNCLGFRVQGLGAKKRRV